MPTKKKAPPSANKKKRGDKQPRAKPVSLHPLTFDEVMERLVKQPRRQDRQDE
jgi:hypothetical protein